MSIQGRVDRPIMYVRSIDSYRHISSVDLFPVSTFALYLYLMSLAPLYECLYRTSVGTRLLLDGTSVYRVMVET